MPKLKPRELEAIWERFIKGEETAEDERRVDSLVWQSWLRSRQAGVEPLQAKVKILQGRELEKILEKNRLLIAVAQSYLTKLSSFLQGEQFVVLITDAAGIVLDVAGGTCDYMSESKVQTYMHAGASRDENYAGTNATGTCLILDQPLQIRGAEHFIKAHHIFTCSAAPIHDHDGRIIGCLSVLGPVQVHYKHTLGMVVAAADGIEKEFKLRQAYRQTELVNSQLSRTLQALSTGVIMTDPTGVIVQFNEYACKILRQSRQNLAGKHLAEYMRTEAPDPNLERLENEFYNRETTVLLKSGESLSISLTACIIRGSERQAGTVFMFDRTRNINRVVSQRSGFTARYTFDDLIGESPEMIQAKAISRLAAERDSTVLILGESGTGKELFAQAIHNASARASGPFIAINCGALPQGLIESEMFGYVSGAFTGASKEGQPGKFELADHGTIFLDEIGDMPLASQAALLRVLQLKEIVRIGGKKSIPVDVRIIAATNRDLAGKIQDKTFRGDLFYRLNVFPIKLPALRSRGGDIRLLAEHFLLQGRASGFQAQELTEQAMALLERYSWPGNVRELQNVMERAMNIASSTQITPAQLPDEIRLISLPEPAAQREPDIPASAWSIESRIEQLKGSEGEMIHLALQRTGGNVSRASQLLGIPRKTLYRKIQACGIDVSRYRFDG